MSYCVRLLTPSEKILSFRDIREQADTVELVSGTENTWETITISQPDGSPIALLERYSLSSGGEAEKELMMVKDSLHGRYPENARAWLEKYISGTRSIYTFRLQAENIDRTGWPVLGRIQNLLKDNLGGIIQADREGFYNEAGDYVLWQMYEGAAGTIPAAVLNERGEWTAYQLKLNDTRAVEQFKQGLPPSRGFLDRLLGR
ncbi:MAG: hypothetical protein JXA46_10715 [Dehalococcoidales bacterium]|nr:hypothetical protein [Dehalococcoidales bacterium]